MLQQLEQTIIFAILKLAKLEKESKTGMLVATLVFIVSTITALAIIAAVVYGWFNVLQWFLSFYDISL